MSNEGGCQAILGVLFGAALVVVCVVPLIALPSYYMWPLLEALEQPWQALLMFFWIVLVGIGCGGGMIVLSFLGGVGSSYVLVEKVCRSPV